MKTINERSGLEVKAIFESETGPTVPSTAHWKLDCATTGTSLIGWTEQTVLTESDQFGLRESYIVIDIPGGKNLIEQTSNKREQKNLLVVADKDTDREFSEEVPYYVKQTKGRG